MLLHSRDVRGSHIAQVDPKILVRLQIVLKVWSQVSLHRSPGKEVGLLSVHLLTGSSFTSQTVAVRVSEDVFDRQEPSFHFAVNGKAFTVITEHFPQLLQKVQTSFCPDFNVVTLENSFIVFT